MQQEQQQDGERFNCWYRHDSELPSEPQNQQCLCFFCSSSLSLSRSPPPLSLFGWWSSYWSQGQSLSWTDESDMFNVIPHVYFDLKPIWTYRKYEVPKYLYSLRGQYFSLLYLTCRWSITTQFNGVSTIIRSYPMTSVTWWCCLKQNQNPWDVQWLKKHECQHWGVSGWTFVLEQLWEDIWLLRSEVESVPYLCWGGGETGHIISQLVSSYSLEMEIKLHKSDV